MGTFATEEDAAEAYDIATIKFRGVNAVTNFEMNRYDVEAILKSALPVGGAAKRLKMSEQPQEQKSMLTLEHHHHQPQENPQIIGTSGNINFGSTINQHQQLPYALPLGAASYYQQAYFNHHINSGNGNGSGGHPLSSDSSMVVNPVNLLPNPPSEFYLWPNQQNQ